MAVEWRKCVWCNAFTARMMLFGTCRQCVYWPLAEARYGVYIAAMLLAALGFFDVMTMLLDYMVK